MGAVERHTAPSVKTSELTNWICKVRVKKRHFKRKNLFIDAVLANALLNAEHLLRVKQRERKMRWQEIKSTLATRSTPQEQRAALNGSNMEAAIIQDLNSIDDFMFQLSQIKVPVQR